MPQRQRWVHADKYVYDSSSMLLLLLLLLLLSLVALCGAGVERLAFLCPRALLMARAFCGCCLALRVPPPH